MRRFSAQLITFKKFTFESNLNSKKDIIKSCQLNMGPDKKQQELIDGCIEGKRKSQHAFYNHYAPKMMGVCLRYAKDETEAQDILQDGFVKVFSNIHRYKPIGPFDGWVRRIFVNTAIEYYRARRKFLLSDIELENAELEFNESVVDKMAAEEIMGLFKEMPDGYRMVFNMYAVEGYTHKEIGEELGISIGTSKSQYSRARTYLQRLIKNREVERLIPQEKGENEFGR